MQVVYASNVYCAVYIQREVADSHVCSVMLEKDKTCSGEQIHLTRLDSVDCRMPEGFSQPVLAVRFMRRRMSRLCVALDTCTSRSIFYHRLYCWEQRWIGTNTGLPKRRPQPRSTCCTEHNAVAPTPREALRPALADT